MSLSLGIDLGTSAVKVVLIGEDQKIVASASSPIATSRPRPLWSEQVPDAWVGATFAAIDRVAADAGIRMAEIGAIGLSGQMHGLVLLDADDRPLRPAIIWNDGRAHAEARTLEALGADIVARIGVLPMPGFIAPKLLWLAAHEPAVLAAARHILLPKDFLRLHLTGESLTDPSDASGAWLIDATTRDWSPEVLAACGIDRAMLPGIVEGSEPAGRLRGALAARWGMPAHVVVAGGAGDTAAGAIGIGAVEPGRAFTNLGTSGQLFVATDRHRPAVASLVHAYCHGVPGRWFRMAAMLNGASPLAFAAGLLGGDVDTLIGEVEASFRAPSPVLVLPYLAGERTPHNDPFASGVVFGLTGDTRRSDVVQGFMEGVAFTFADAADALDLGAAPPDRLGFIGGGARSRLWGRMIASVLGLPLVRYAASDVGPAIGAARLGFVAAGASLGEVCTEPPAADTIEPDLALADAYRPRIEAWRGLYRSLKPNFRSTLSRGDPG